MTAHAIPITSRSNARARRRALLLAALLFCAFASNSRADERSIRLEGSWDYCGSSQAPDAIPVTEVCAGNHWRPMALLTGGPRVRDRQAWVRKRLPDVAWPDAMLLLSTDARRLQVRLDGQVIYDYTELPAKGRSSATHSFALPPGFGGKLLFVWVSNPGASNFDTEACWLYRPAGFPQVIDALLRPRLQNDLNQIIPGAILAVAGVAALVVGILRRRRRSYWAVLAFGVFCTTYGIRLVIGSWIFTYAVPLPRAARDAINIVSAYASPLAAWFLGWRLLGDGWRKSLRVVLIANVVFVMFEIPLQVFTGVWLMSTVWWNLFVMACLAASIGNVFFYPIASKRDATALRTAFVIFTASAINTNLVTLRLVPWQWANDPAVFVVFAAGLGYVAVAQAFRNESELATINRELETAQQIQASILPKRIPDIAGLDAAVRYRPMTAVAGDFYDFHPAGERRVGVLVADVSGHGVPAALVASMLKVAFASNADRAADPGALLSALNASFHGQLDGSFITACYVFLDLDAGRLLHANAGHPPALLWRASSGTVDSITEGGLMLGPFPRVCYANSGRTLTPGDRIVLYTDGVIEASNPAGEPFGEARLRGIVTEHAVLPAGAFADRLLAEVDAWSGRGKADREQEDDITVAILDIA